MRLGCSAVLAGVVAVLVALIALAADRSFDQRAPSVTLDDPKYDYEQVAPLFKFVIARRDERIVCCSSLSPTHQQCQCTFATHSDYLSMCSLWLPARRPSNQHTMGGSNNYTSSTYTSLSGARPSKMISAPC